MNLIQTKAINVKNVSMNITAIVITRMVSPRQRSFDSWALNNDFVLHTDLKKRKYGTRTNKTQSFN